ncbi:MAG: haloacid dehalogenase [Acidimicrobiales bacterium]|nr:MAG: haloacid dehalogenase [Acidimicrobiales bacterium]
MESGEAHLKRRSPELASICEEIRSSLDALEAAREQVIVDCRRIIRMAGSVTRAVHRLEWDRARQMLVEATDLMRGTKQAIAGHPELAHGGVLADAERELAEAWLTLALARGKPPAGPDELGVSQTAWLHGLAEAASEMRRHLLDRLREGDLATAHRLLEEMDEVYDLLSSFDHPDAVTGGLRRTVDALRATLERSRGDVTNAFVMRGVEHPVRGHAGREGDG